MLSSVGYHEIHTPRAGPRRRCGAAMPPRFRPSHGRSREKGRVRDFRRIRSPAYRRGRIRRPARRRGRRTHRAGQESGSDWHACRRFGESAHRDGARGQPISTTANVVAGSPEPSSKSFSSRRAGSLENARERRPIESEGAPKFSCCGVFATRAGPHARWKMLTIPRDIGWDPPGSRPCATRSAAAARTRLRSGRTSRWSGRASRCRRA